MARLEIFSAQKKFKKIRYFSEELKKRIVKDLEAGVYTVHEASREHEVSRTAVYKWLYKYSRTSKQEERINVESKSYSKKVIELQERIKELERIIGQKQLSIDFQAKMIELAEEEYKVDIKKKSVLSHSSGSGKTGLITNTK